MWYLGALLLWRLGRPLLRPLPPRTLVALTTAATCVAPRAFADGSSIWGAADDSNPFSLKLAVSFLFAFGLGLVTGGRLLHLSAI